jgi:cytochrome b6-f complex iron-sulfur subunit
VRRRTRRADRFIDAIADDDALPSGRLDDPDDAAALGAAISLKAGRAAADLPSGDFVAKLGREITEERDGGGRRRWSRRAVLGTAVAAGAAAAAGVAGVALDRTVLQTAEPSSRRTAAELEPTDGEWLAVATGADLASGAPHRFATAALVGFVTKTDTGMVAVSAACTHLGCILQANDAAGRLDCPCHRTAFGHDGRLLFSQLPASPAPLTRLAVRRQNDTVEVYVPRTV